MASERQGLFSHTRFCGQLVVLGRLRFPDALSFRQLIQIYEPSNFLEAFGDPFACAQISIQPMALVLGRIGNQKSRVLDMAGTPPTFLEDSASSLRRRCIDSFLNRVPLLVL